MSFEKKVGDPLDSGSYTTTVYVVEAKTTHGEYVLSLDQFGCQLGNLILNTHEWKQIHPEFGPVGIPNRMEFYPEATKRGYMTFACAMGIACWLQAQKDYGGVITRLVVVKFEASYSTRVLGFTAPYDLHEAELTATKQFHDVAATD